MTLLAERAGVSTTGVLVAGIGGPSRDAALVVRPPPGVRLSELDEPALTDQLLDTLFRHRARPAPGPDRPQCAER